LQNTTSEIISYITQSLSITAMRRNAHAYTYMHMYMQQPSVCPSVTSQCSSKMD